MHRSCEKEEKLMSVTQKLVVHALKLKILINRKRHLISKVSSVLFLIKGVIVFEYG